MGSKAKVPRPNPEADYQQYVTEGSNALRAQDVLLRKQIGYEAGLQPLLTAQQMASLKGEAQGMLGLYGDLYAPAQQMQQRYATDQLSMMSGMGQQATQASLGSLDPTTRGIYDTFGQQALSDLQQGSALNAQETNQAQQAARAAGAARGLSFSRQGSDLEVLNTYGLGQQRKQQRHLVEEVEIPRLRRERHKDLVARDEVLHPQPEPLRLTENREASAPAHIHPCAITRARKAHQRQHRLRRSVRHGEGRETVARQHRDSIARCREGHA